MTLSINSNRLTMRTDVADPNPSAKRVQRVRHELKFRELEVVRVSDITPHMRAVVFKGPLEDFTSPAFDDHIKLFIAQANGEEARRDYTPRFDAASGELTLEFALHGDGPAATWAEQAAVGQHVRIGGPRGSFLVPVDYAWHLLVGDETALPAICRRLEELPAGTRVTVIGQVPEADRRPLSSAAQLDVQWVDDAEACLAAIRAWALPAGEGYVWGGGEGGLMAELRRLLVDEKGHDKHAIRAAAYWHAGHGADAPPAEA
ncbi:siderophore-interacting protein [Ideonella azotifigens]|uniref:Siderophore-interacting protein n=3 Tax=Ideonella azotifigens TaxID=513160 RepID=A0ABP3VHF4_9BURK